MVCGPRARVDVWKVVTFEFTKVDVPKVVAPSRYVTCPVGTVWLPTVAKVAVKVTFTPGFGLGVLTDKASVVEPRTTTATDVDVLGA